MLTATHLIAIVAGALFVGIGFGLAIAHSFLSPFDTLDEEGEETFSRSPAASAGTTKERQS